MTNSRPESEGGFDILQAAAELVEEFDDITGQKESSLDGYRFRWVKPSEETAKLLLEVFVHNPEYEGGNYVIEDLLYCGLDLSKFSLVHNLIQFAYLQLLANKELSFVSTSYKIPDNTTAAAVFGPPQPILIPCAASGLPKLELLNSQNAIVFRRSPLGQILQYREFLKTNIEMTNKMLAEGGLYPIPPYPYHITH